MTSSSSTIRAGLVVASSLVYVAGANNALTTWDDPLYLTQNARIVDRSLDAFFALWSPSAALHGKFIEFFPLRDTVYWLLHAAFGFAPAAYHLTSLVLHVVTALLVAALAERSGFAKNVATLAGVLFAAHPIHVEAVQWAASLKDPLYALLVCAALLAYAKFASAAEPASVSRPNLSGPRATSVTGTGPASRAASGAALSPHLAPYLAALAFTFAALLVKSFAIATPVLVVAWELSRPREERASLRTIAVRVAPFTALALAFVVLFVAVGRANAVISEMAPADRIVRIATEGFCLVRYTALLVVPLGMRVEYQVAPLHGLFDVRSLAALVGVTAYVAALVLVWRRDRRAWFWLAWFAALLLPAAQIIPFPALMADRYLYLASAGFCVLAAWGLLSISLSSKLRAAFLALVVGVYLFGTFVRVRQWSDERNLWLEIVDDDPQSVLGWKKLAEASALQNDGESVVRYALKAASVAKDPRDLDAAGAKKLAVVALMGLGRYDDAAKVARDLLASFPALPEIWDALARCSLHLGRIDDEVRAAEHAVEFAPDDADYRFFLAMARVDANDASDAAKDITAAVRLDKARECPRFVEWRDHFGKRDLVDAVVAAASVDCR